MDELFARICRMAAGNEACIGMMRIFSGCQLNGCLDVYHVIEDGGEVFMY